MKAERVVFQDQEMVRLSQLHRCRLLKLPHVNQAFVSLEDLNRITIRAFVLV